jgi:hypothetical protein
MFTDFELTGKNRCDNFSGISPMTKKEIYILPAISLATLAHAGTALGCAVCLSGADEAITQGYNASVLFLMATPYIVGSGIAAGLLFAYRRALRRRQQDEEKSIVQLAWNQEESSR